MKQEEIDCYNCCFEVKSATLFPPKRNFTDAIVSVEIDTNVFQPPLLKVLHARELRNKYAVPNLKFLMKKKLIQNLSLENLTHFYELSILNNDYQVTLEMLEFFKKKESKIIPSDWFWKYVIEYYRVSHYLIKTL